MPATVGPADEMKVRVPWDDSHRGEVTKSHPRFICSRKGSPCGNDQRQTTAGRPTSPSVAEGPGLEAGAADDPRCLPLLPCRGGALLGAGGDREPQSQRHDRQRRVAAQPRRQSDRHPDRELVLHAERTGKGRADPHLPPAGRGRCRRRRRIAEGLEDHCLPPARRQPADPPGAEGRGGLGEGGCRGRFAAPSPPHHLPQRPRIPAVRRRGRLARLLTHRTGLCAGHGRATRTARPPRLRRSPGRPAPPTRRHLQRRLPAGNVDIVKWNHGSGAPANVWFAKQNLPPIIYEGKLASNLGDGPEWGETVNNAVRVWRAGLGIDAHGNLMYAAANYQTVESLAKVLQRAGAVRALELDINEDWTSFISYRRPGAVSPSNLLPEMYRSPERYLTPDERDFFAVYLRPGQ